MAYTIAVLSQKGGTGKTTAVRTLADAFRRSEVRTLAVDLDPQGNLSDYFDLDPEVAPTIADVLAGRAKASEAVHSDLIPANLSLAEAELMLGGKMGRELTLRRALAELPGEHDLILIDCPPSLGLLTVNALVAADRALVTAEAQYFALQGVVGRAGALDPRLPARPGRRLHLARGRGAPAAARVRGGPPAPAGARRGRAHVAVPPYRSPT